MQYPNIIVVEMIKRYAERIIENKNDDNKLLYTSKSNIERREGDFLQHTDIIKQISKQHFVKRWEITDYPTTNHLSKDGFKCYELISNLNHWDSVLVILPPNPTEIQQQEWNQVMEYIR